MNWGAIPSLPALRAFEAAGRCLNFSKAARELNVTPAAIAQHVRSLEAEFSESLLYRQGRGLALTPAGSDLAESLRAGFQEIAGGVDRLRASREKRPLKISATPAFANSWLMPRIGGFWKKHPEISIDINTSTDLVDMVRDGFDLAIRFGDGSWPGVSAEPLTSGEFWVVAHPDLISDRPLTCLGDVAHLPWLLEETMSELYSIVEREGIDFNKVNVTKFHTNSLVMSGVLSGLGL
ncbi:MAG: LysR substrate-binding domain-containing protein, partial [Paracoccaceae bacterium]